MDNSLLEQFSPVGEPTSISPIVVEPDDPVWFVVWG